MLHFGLKVKSETNLRGQSQKSVAVGHNKLYAPNVTLQTVAF